MTAPRILLVAIALPALMAAPVERRLYVAEDRGGVSVYDIDRGHQFIRRIDVPNSGVYKGIAASASLGRLYLTSNAPDTLICLDLSTDREIWRKTLGAYADSPAITPDGRTLYMPYRREDNWKAIDAATGDVKATIAVARGKQYEVDSIEEQGPHNTWMNRDGTRVYLEVLTEPYVWIADTRTNTLLGKVGPFGKGIRPFAVTDDERWVYANVDGLLGFEIGAVKNGARWGGPMTSRVEATTPAARLAEIPNPPKNKPHLTPSHGVNVRPDQKEVWMVDGVYGYVYVYDISAAAPRQVASIPLFQPVTAAASGVDHVQPRWPLRVPDGGGVIDTATKHVVSRIPTREKLIEIDFENGKATKAGHR